MGIIYDRNFFGKQNDYYHKLNSEVQSFAKFIQSKDLGLSEDQIKGLLLDFRGRTGKTKKDDVLDLYKDVIKDHLNHELNNPDSVSRSQIAEYLSLKYYDGKDRDSESKKRLAHYEKLIRETDELTDDWLSKWFDDFLDRTDCVMVIGNKPNDIFWYTIEGKSETLAIETKGYSDGYIDFKLKNAPKGMKPVLYVYNPACWMMYDFNGNHLEWIKARRVGIEYVPKDAKFSSLDWLNDPSE